MKHTEGEWIQDGLQVRVVNRGIIAVTPTPPKGGVFECAHNASLIAAAPELLEALTELVRVNEEWNSAVQSVIGRPTGWNANYLDAAKAAIKKAEG